MAVLQQDLDFLAHHGVKGMRWGVRRNRDRSTGSTKSSGSSTKTESQKDNSARNKKIAIAVGIGAVAATAIILNRRNTPTRQLGRITETMKLADSPVGSNFKPGTSDRIKRKNYKQLTKHVEAKEKASMYRENIAKRLEANADRYSKIKVSDLKPPAAKPKISAEAQRDLAKLRAESARLVREANNDLRAGYNRNNTPFSLREFLEEWT